MLKWKKMAGAKKKLKREKKKNPQTFFSSGEKRLNVLQEGSFAPSKGTDPSDRKTK